MLAGMTASGLVLLAAARVRPAISLAADFVVSFLIGAGAITLIVFWSSFVSSNALTAGLVLAVAMLPVAAILLLGRLRHAAALLGRIPVRPVWLLEVPLTVLVAYQSCLVAISALHSGPGWDGIFVWEIKARYFFNSGGVPQSIFFDTSREWSHPTYPLLFPLVEAVAYWALGGPHQWADMVITAAFILGLAILFFELIRNVGGAFLAALLTLVLITSTAFWDNALQAFADLPVALFLLAGAWFVYRWFDHGRRLQDLILGGALLALAMWVKREGVVVWATGAVVMAAWAGYTSIRLRSLAWRPLCAFLVPAAAILPWWLAVAHGTVTDRDYVPFTVRWLLQHADRIPVLIGLLVAQLTLVPMWGIAWILIAAGVVLRPPIRSPGRRFLLAAVLAHTIALTLVYTFSSWMPYTDQVTASMMRVVFQVFPIGLLLLATGLERDWWRPVPFLRRKGVPEEEGIPARVPL